MSPFGERLGPAIEHERAVRDLLTKHGWLAQEYGAAMLTDQMAEALRATESLLRWTPDIIACRETQVVLVDAKTGRDDTPNYCIEKRSVDAARAFAIIEPVYFVFHDMQVLSVDDIDLLAVHSKLRTGTNTGAGSGTGFWLIRKAEAHPFTAAFANR